MTPVRGEGPREVKLPEDQAVQPAAPQEGGGVLRTAAKLGLLAIALGAAAYARSKVEPDPVHDGWEEAKDNVRGAASHAARGVGARNAAEHIDTERANAVIKDVGYNVSRGARMLLKDVADLTKET